MKTLIGFVLSLGLCLAPFVASASADKCEEVLSGDVLMFESSEGLVLVPKSEASDYIGGLVRQYRHVGGELYWATKKMRGAYSEYLDFDLVDARTSYLATLGGRLRTILDLGKGHLPALALEWIEIALEDYARYELVEPDPRYY